MNFLYTHSLGKFALSASPTPRYTVLMAIHTIYGLARLGEHELFNLPVARPTSEAGYVVRVFTCHDGLIHDGLFAYRAVVRTVRAYRTFVRQKLQSRVSLGEERHHLGGG